MVLNWEIIDLRIRCDDDEKDHIGQMEGVENLTIELVQCKIVHLECKGDSANGGMRVHKWAEIKECG